MLLDETHKGESWQRMPSPATAVFTSCSSDPGKEAPSCTPCFRAGVLQRAPGSSSSHSTRQLGRTGDFGAPPQTSRIRFWGSEAEHYSPEGSALALLQPLSSPWPRGHASTVCKHLWPTPSPHTAMTLEFPALTALGLLWCLCGLRPGL